jgi:phosphoketolase
MISASAAQQLSLTLPSMARLDLTNEKREELLRLLRGYGWTPYFAEGHEPRLMHQTMAATLDRAAEQIKRIQQDATACLRPARKVST